MLSYPVIASTDEDGNCTVRFVDFPESAWVGATCAEAMNNARRAIAAVAQGYLDARYQVPLPSVAAEGQGTVALPALESAKVLLWNEMLRQKLRKSDLARRLDVHIPQIDRLFDLRHASRLDAVERAAVALGRRLTVELR